MFITTCIVLSNLLHNGVVPLTLKFSLIDMSMPLDSKYLSLLYYLYSGRPF